MKLIDRVADQIVQDLLGSCSGRPDEQTLLNALYNMGKISSETHDSADVSKLWFKVEDTVLRVIDESIFLCECCGWWYDRSDLSDQQYNICQDCYEG